MSKYHYDCYFSRGDIHENCYYSIIDILNKTCKMLLIGSAAQLRWPLLLLQEHPMKGGRVLQKRWGHNKIIGYVCKKMKWLPRKMLSLHLLLER